MFVSNLLAQALSLLLMIFVCRKYYSPADLELFTLFQSAMNFFGILFFLRLDTLFYIEKDRSSRDLIYQLALLLIVGLSLLFFIVNFFLNIYGFDYRLNLLLPLGMILIGFFTISQAKLINEQAITVASITRLTFPMVNFAATYLLIRFGYPEQAMVLGLLTGLLVALLLQLFFTRFRLNFELKLLWEKIAHYRKDLFYGNFIFIINSFRDTLFILFISMMYAPKEYVASYSQGLRIVSLPALVLSGALGSVVGSKLKIEIEDKELFRRNYFRLLFFIIASSLVIYLLAFFFMDPVVELLFSAKWHYAATCAKSLVPWLFMNFIMNALNGYFLVLRLQRVNFIVNLFETSFFIFTFLLLGSYLEFEKTLLIAALWSLVSGTVLLTILSKKILIFTKK